MRKSVVILGICVLLCVVAAVYAGTMGIEILLGSAVAVGFLCLVFIPVFYAREGKVKKIKEKTDALIVFEYMRSEVEEIVKTQRRIARKKSRSLSILFSICLAVIFIPFCVISAQEGGDYTSLIVIAFISILIPWLSLIITPAAAESRIRRTVCTSVVGPDYILIANQYLGINDRYSMRAVETTFVPSKDGMMAQLKVLYRFKGGRTMREFDKWVHVPVPSGRENDAKELKI